MSTRTISDLRLASVAHDEAAKAIRSNPETAAFVAALRSAHSSLSLTLDQQTLELQKVVCDYVTHAKAEGHRAERVIVQLKRAIADAGLSPATGERETINDRVITL